eukprot:403367270
MSLSCGLCNKFYNLTNRKPVGLQCICTFCLECVHLLLNDNPKRQVTCPDCISNSVLAQEPTVNMQILKKIKSQDLLFIICDDHQTQTTQYYCIQCEIPVCTHCKLDTHKTHLIVDLTRSLFQSYQTNVTRIFDEYSIENIKAQLNKQSQNEIQLSSFQFKEMLSKVTRLLIPHITNEEASLIQIQNFLIDPQNPKIKAKQLQSEELQVLPNDVQIDFKQLIKDQIIEQLKESQASMREEFKQTFNAFKNNQNQVNNSIQEQVDKKINSSEDKYLKTIDDLKRELHENLEVKLKALDQINQKITLQNQKILQSEKQIKSSCSIFERSILDLKIKVNDKILLEQVYKNEGDNFRKYSEKLDEVNLKFEQELKECKQEEIQQIIDSTNQTTQSNEDHLLATTEEEEQKTQAIDNNNQTTMVQIPSEDACRRLSDSDKMQLFRDLVDQEINKTQYSLLSQQISNYQTRKYKLLYCGSRDGFEAQDFHEYCDERGPTMSFILSECGYVFGGYASVPWTSSDNHKFYSDADAFIFSLSKRSIHKQFRNMKQAVYHRKDLLCEFGRDDMDIRDKCNENKSICNLGHTYELPEGCVQYSNEAQSYLAGIYQFKVLEIEVYLLK